MKSFLDSTATKALLLALLFQVTKDLVPMLRAHSIDLWLLAENQIVLLGVLFGNALRPDINAPGFNWLNPKEPKG